MPGGERESDEVVGAVLGLRRNALARLVLDLRAVTVEGRDCAVSALVAAKLVELPEEGNVDFEGILARVREERMKRERIPSLSSALSAVDGGESVDLIIS